MFPTGNVVDALVIPGVGTLQATMITAGTPAIFINAVDIGYTGSLPGTTGSSLTVRQGWT